jgi:integrase
MAKRKVQPVPGDGTYGNGSVVPRGTKWRVRWRENGVRQSLSGFQSAQEARDELTRIQARLQLGEPGVEPSTPKPIVSVELGHPKTFSELLDDFIAYRVAHKRRMAQEDRSRWERHLAGALETQTVRDLSTKWVRELARELVNPTPGTKAPDGSPKDPISGQTAQRVLALLSSFYSWAIREGLADTNPVRPALRDPDLKALLASTHDKETANYLKSWSEVDRLYKALGRTPVGVCFYLQARAGLRPGEAMALRWGSVDLGAKVLTVRASVRSGKVGPPKSGKPRKVPIAPKLGAELAKWKTASGPRTTDTDLVCPPPTRVGDTGKFLGKKTIGPALTTAFKATKIKPGKMYDVGRHTFGSLVGLSANVSAPRLQTIMGHASITTTLRYVSLASQPFSAKELAALG